MAIEKDQDRCGDLCIERQLAAPMRHIAPLPRHPSIETPKARAMCARHVLGAPHSILY
jgi:hypothetical protein